MDQLGLLPAPIHGMSRALDTGSGHFSPSVKVTASGTLGAWVQVFRPQIKGSTHSATMRCACRHASREVGQQVPGAVGPKEARLAPAGAQPHWGPEAEGNHVRGNSTHCPVTLHSHTPSLILSIALQWRMGSGAWTTMGAGT